ncbi:MAG TPA: hypothetical protein VLM38_04975 [Blastocatellia bacterium]|nr:hypothetical protein [Blastocatellia bacterium]
MAKARQPADVKKGEVVIEEERSRFKALLAQNPNYFGNVAASSFKAVKKLVANTKYEELTCVGYNPVTSFLEATVAVKLPAGYGSDLCHAGTTEYVRFFVNYGSGWEDAGLAAINVHDIPNERDCAGLPNKPLTYVASLKYEPKAECCNHPVLPKVHAILSWQLVPPAGPANVGWLPPWGNTHECHVQIKPHPWNIFCLFDLIGTTIDKKIKVPKLFEQVQYQPIPLPDPPPPTIAELAEMYAPGTTKSAATVESHRFGISELHATLSAAGVDQETTAAKSVQWKSLGLDWAGAIAALDKTKANVTYEELECLGIDDAFPERLVATFRIKRPQGYSGDLCHKGSIEYVSFWADWDNTCEWTYVGTQKVNVHDISTIPKEGLCYSAIQPVDLTYHRRSCRKPKIARVRAVLSWAVPPSPSDPDDLQYWGNRIDTHVQIVPGDQIDPNNPLAKIRNLGGIAIEDIDTGGNGMTKVVAFGGGPVKFAGIYHAYTADGWGQNRQCPFGGTIAVEGNYYLGYYYRVRVHKIGDPGLPTALTTDFYVERSDIGYDHQVPIGEWFKYLDPIQEFGRGLAYWSSSGDAPWEVQLDVATAPNEASIVSSSPWYRIQLDNTGPVGPPAIFPTMDIHISAGGDCKDFDEGSTITGTFIANDLHFGGWSLSTEPNTFTTPSNPPEVVGLSPWDPAPGPGGHAWTLHTSPPPASLKTMKPCGYVVRLDVSDRTIVHSSPFVHNWNHIEVGFCLREKA